MKRTKFFAWTLLLLTFEECKTSLINSFGNSYKIIRGNATSYVIEDVEDTKDLEYPRHKNQILQMVQQMWIDYYSCLQKSGDEERRPEIRYLLEGQHTEFQCVLCPRPFQNYDELEWKYKPLSSDSDIRDLEYLDLTREMTLTMDKTLQIYNAKEDFAGLYVCYQKENVLSVYLLEVSKNDKIEKNSTSDTRDEIFVELNGNEFKIYYQWTQWTECSSCGKVGRRFKYGTCFISSKEISVETGNCTDTKKIKKSVHRRSMEFFENKNLFKGKLFLKNSTSEDGIYKNWGVETIEKFSTGIPCASKYLPRASLAYTQKHKALKVAVKYCLESCEEYQIFEVFDAYGRVIEMANNSAGIYSILQKLPKLPPDIERTSVTADFGKDIIIQCPGTLLSTIPVTWKINNQVLFPEIIANASKGRFIVDLVNRIQIKKLRLKDSRIYSCWQRNKLIGTVNLNVEKKFKIAFDHHVTLVVLLVLIGIFLLVGRKVISGELKARKK